jgi:hypothetical protein
VVSFTPSAIWDVTSPEAFLDHPIWRWSLSLLHHTVYLTSFNLSSLYFLSLPLAFTCRRAVTLIATDINPQSMRLTQFFFLIQFIGNILKIKI